MCRRQEGMTIGWWCNLLALGLAVGLGTVEGLGAGKAFGALTTSLTVTPISVTAGSDFQASYFTGLVSELPSSTLSSIPGLAENVLVSTGSGFQVVLPSPTGTSFVQLLAYHKQDIVLDWPVGVWGVVSELAFSWDTRRHYLWSHAWVHYAGVQFRLVMAVARADAATGSGMEVGIEGTTLAGMAFRMTSQFGLATGRTALARAVSLGNVGGEMSDYRATTLTASVVPFCCLGLSTTARLTKSGFESLQITTSYAFTFATTAVSASVTFEFTTETRELTVVPRLQLPGSGTEIYLSYSLVPARLSPSSPSLTGVRLDEIGLSRVQLGELSVSGRYSFTGNLCRGALPMPTRCDLLFSFGRSTLDTSLTCDLYFASEGAYLLGLALFTFQAEATWFGDLRVRVGFDIVTDSGWWRLTAEVRYTFNVYGL